MKTKLIAQRYARALVANLPKEDHASLLADLQQLKKIFSSDILQKLDSRLFTRKDKLEMSDLIAKETNHPKLWYSLFQILVKKQRVAVLPAILDQIDEIILVEQNKQRVILKLAQEQTPEIIESIKKKISKYFDKEIIVEIEIDPSIIGGFEVYAGSTQINASVRASLQKFLGKLK